MIYTWILVLQEGRMGRSNQTVTGYLAMVKSEKRRRDAKAVMKIMREVTGKRAVLWGSSIIGYDTYHYKYESGREGDMPMVGLSPRAQNLVVYIMPGFSNYDGLMSKLGKHKTGKSCLYINKLEDVDQAVLRKLIAQSYAHMQKKYA